MDARDWMRRAYPEWECVERGDPFLEVLVRYDEAIDACGHPDDGQPDRNRAVTFEVRRLTYERWVLDRWWQLPAPQPP